MKFLIYDDNKEDIDHLISLLERFSEKYADVFDIDICDSTDFLLENIEKYDFLFLDIEIDKENGIDIGKQLINLNHHCRIIITSRYKKYLIQGYKIHADRYFLKPILQAEFDAEMNDEIYVFKKKYSGFLDENISNKKILFSDILYIDVCNRKTRIHFTNEKVLVTRYSLKDWFDILDMSIFEQTHKSYIINLIYVIGYSKQDVYLSNGESIPISRNMKKHFEEKYIEVIPRIIL